MDSEAGEFLAEMGISFRDGELESIDTALEELLTSEFEFVRQVLGLAPSSGADVRVGMVT